MIVVKFGIMRTSTSPVLARATLASETTFVVETRGTLVAFANGYACKASAIDFIGILQMIN